jgi:polysaccharide biosynthesis protein VpsM
LQGGYLDKRYVNNRDLGTAALDHSQTDYGGTFLWRALPKTYATFNLKRSVYNYKEATSTLDSTNTYALLGVRWEATAATSGRFALGNVTKKFDAAGHDAGRKDLSLGPAWEGGINWKPRTYSSVDFNTQRTPVDSTGLGNFTINETYQILWTHAWNSRFSSNLTGGYSTDKFSNAPVLAAGGADRKDATKSAGLRLTYSMQRWLKLGAEYLYTVRDSNDDNFDYKRNQLMFFISGTL